MVTVKPELKATIQSAGTIATKRAEPPGMARSMLLTIFANFLIVATAIVSGPLAARLLGPSGRGELAAVQNIYLLVAYGSMFGLAEGTLFFVARSPAKSVRILATSSFMVLAGAAVFILASYFVAPAVLKGQSPGTLWLARVSLMFIWVQSLLALIQFAIRGMNRILEWNIARIVPAAGWMVLLLFMALRGGASVSAVMFGYLGILGLSIVTGLALFLRNGSGRGSIRPDLSLAKPLLGYGIPLLCASVPQTLNLRLDQLLIAGMLPASALGFYAVAVGWSGAVTPLMAAIANVLFPKLAGATSMENSAIVFGRVIRIGIMSGLVLSAMLIAVTPTVLPLMFGRTFRPSVPSATILLAASVISGANTILEEGLRGLGSTWSIFASEGVGLIATIVCLVYLLPRQGIIGAALSSVLGYGVTSIVLVFYVLKILRVSFASFLVPTKDDFVYLRQRAAAVLVGLKKEWRGDSR